MDKTVLPSLAEQKKLPWCDCDFRATGLWGWCNSGLYDCLGKKLALASQPPTEGNKS